MHARAQVAPGAISSAADLVPADSDVVVVVDRANEWRNQALGEPLWRLTGGLLDAADTAKAWDTLAKSLGMSREAAFDALLGRRAIFVQRSGAQGAAATWAIVSLVDRATELALRERLKPSPRAFAQGLTVMTLEDGRFLLAVVRTGDASTLLLGPALAPAMFEEIAPRLGRPARGGLGDDPVAIDLRNLERVVGGEHARALALVRVAKDEPGWVGLLATPKGRDLNVEMFARTPSLAAAAAKVEPWSRDAFDDLQHDVYFAAMEWNLGAEDQWTALGALRTDLPIFRRPFERPELLGLRTALVLRPSTDALASIVIGVETTDSAELAPIGDRMIAGALGSFWPAQAGAPDGGAAPADAALDIQGAFPRAMREVDLSVRLGALLPMVFDRGPTLTWSYAPGGSAREGGGWWTMGLDRRATEHVTERLTMERRRGERPAPWITIGVARPALLLAEIERRKFPTPPQAARLLGALREVEHVRWELLRVNDGSARGRVSVRIIERAAAPGGPGVR